MTAFLFPVTHAILNPNDSVLLAILAAGFAGLPILWHDTRLAGSKNHNTGSMCKLKHSQRIRQKLKVMGSVL
jgi:hypothetical protein